MTNSQPVSYSYQLFNTQSEAVGAAKQTREGTKRHTNKKVKLSMFAKPNMLPKTIRIDKLRLQKLVASLYTSKFSENKS